MNQKNYDFLKDSLKYLGFGEKLNDKLEEQLKKGPATFQLEHSAEYKRGETPEKVNYVLDFRKSNQSDMYFFNSYKATLNPEDPAKATSQTFYINRNSGITAKEAYNLLSGRAVNKDLTNKENQPYNAWLQLDFKEKDQHDNFKVKQFTQGYGYDLEQSLSKYPIRELSEPDQKERLLNSLHKGNLTAVTFVREEKDSRMYLEANPQFKSMIVYDANFKKQFQENEKKSEQEKTPDKKIKAAAGEEQEPGQKKSRRKGIGV